MRNLVVTAAKKKKKGTEQNGKDHQQYVWRCGVKTINWYKGKQSYAIKISPKSPLHHQELELLPHGRMNPCFHVNYTNFCPYHLNVEIETPIFVLSSLLFYFGESVKS